MLKVSKLVLFNAQNEKWMAPMAPECLKPLIWALPASGLEKIELESLPGSFSQFFVVFDPPKCTQND
jgi:hypothetical protein